MTMQTDHNGTRRWYNHANQLHREDGPAIEWADGTKYWYRDGVLHREDGPAVECVNGTKQWYLNGVSTNPLASTPNTITFKDVVRWLTQEPSHIGKMMDTVMQLNAACEEVRCEEGQEN